MYAVVYNSDSMFPFSLDSVEMAETLKDAELIWQSLLVQTDLAGSGTDLIIEVPEGKTELYVYNYLIPCLPVDNTCVIESYILRDGIPLS